MPTSEEIERFVVEQIRVQATSAKPKESFSLETLLNAVNHRFYLSGGDAPNLKPSCPFPIRMIPSLNAFAAKQARIVAKIQCAVAARPVVTIAELEDEICFAEGVAHFSQLGFGNSITSMDIIQQFFRVNQAFAPRRVTSEQFMAYLISDDGARKLLTAGADATDLVQGFTRFVGLRHANDCGIHIQNLPWLLAILRAEVGRTSQVLEKRQQQAAALGNGIARIAQSIGSSLWAALQECPSGTMGDFDELVLHTDDPAAELLPASLRTQGANGGAAFIVCSRERANKLIQCAVRGDDEVPHTPTAPFALPSPKVPPAHHTTLSTKLRPVGGADDIIDIDDLEEEEMPQRASVHPLHAALEQSFINRIVYCATDEEADSVRRCVDVLSHQAASSLSSMSSEDFSKFRLLADVSGLSDLMRAVDLARRALDERQILIISPETSGYHRSLMSRMALMATDDEGSLCLAEKLCNVPECDADHLVLPVFRGDSRLLLTVRQLTDPSSWPCTVLDGSAMHGLASTAPLSRLAPNRVQCVDTSVLLGASPLSDCRFAIIALQGFGIPTKFSFPSVDEHPFPLGISDVLAQNSLSLKQRHDTLHQFYSFAAAHWSSNDCSKPLCALLCSSKWIPVHGGRGSQADEFHLRAPADVMDPSPKMMRLFEGIGAFAPTICANDGAVETPSAKFLTSIGAQLSPKPSLVLDALSSLRPGAVVPVAQLERMYAFLGGCTKEELARDRNRPMIVMPSSDAIGLTGSGMVEVACVLLPDECCWERVSISDDEQMLFHRSLEPFYNASLADVFTNFIGVERKCHLHCWASSMRWNRGRLSRAQYDKCTPVLRTLTIRCFEQHLLQPTSVRARNRPIAVISPNEALFPCAGGWHSARDRIIFDGLSVSLTDTYRHSMGPPKPHPSINFFVLSRRIDQPMKSLLTEMGLKEFSTVAETTLMFEQFDLLGSTAMHTKLVECAPHIQRLLKSRFPSYYEQVKKEVEKLLHRMFVVVCQKPFVLHAIRPTGIATMEKGDQSFHVRKSVVTHFDRSNFVLYVADGTQATHVLAEVFAELFCPLFFQDVFDAVADALQFLISASDISRQSKLSGRSLYEHVAFSQGEEWVVSAPFSERYRQHFPPGTDGLSSPTVRTRGAERIPQGEPIEAWATLEFTRHDVVMRQVQASGIRGGELMSMKRNRETDAVSDDEDSPSSNDEANNGGAGDRRRRRRKLRFNGASSPTTSGPLLMPKEGRGYDVSAEQFAFQELQSSNASAGIQLRWVNATGEQGTPFDLVAVRSEGGVERVVQYYEVKSTCTKDRKDFEMSLRELLFAARYGKQYTVVRVFGASESNLTRMRLEQYPDPVGLWQRGGMTMTGDVKVMII